VNGLAAPVAKEELHVGVVGNMLITALHARVNMGFSSPLAEGIFAGMKEPHRLLVDNVVSKVECHRVLDDAVEVSLDL